MNNKPKRIQEVKIKKDLLDYLEVIALLGVIISIIFSYLAFLQTEKSIKLTNEAINISKESLRISNESLNISKQAVEISKTQVEQQTMESEINKLLNEISSYEDYAAKCYTEENVSIKLLGKLSLAKIRVYENITEARRIVDEMIENDFGNYMKFLKPECIGGAAVTCTESWSCTDWSACIDGIKTRTCIDSDNCGTIVNKPAESGTCQAEGAVTTGLPTESVVITVVAIIAIVIIAIIGNRKKIVPYISKSMKKKHKK